MSIITFRWRRVGRTYGSGSEKREYSGLGHPSQNLSTELSTSVDNFVQSTFLFKAKLSRILIVSVPLAGFEHDLPQTRGFASQQNLLL